MKLKKSIIILFVLNNMITSLKAQQELQMSTYFFNQLYINPAYAGSQKSLVVNATIRDQWTNFKGAPKSQVLSMHSPLKKDLIGVGFSIINDEIGVRSNKTIALDWSVGVKLNKKNHRLALGLKLGVDVYQTNFNNAKIQDNTEDIYLDGYNYTKILPNVGGGLYYYGDRFYLGVSTPRVIKNSFNLPSGQAALQENHFYFFGGCVVKLNSLVNMRPSIIIKYVNNAPVSIDGNLSFLIMDKIWLGAMYRYNSAMGMNMIYNVTERMSVGYAYDYGLNSIQQYSVGSHEIMLSYMFKSKSKGYISPRYF